MYNSIYPININYRNVNPYAKQGLNNNTQKENGESNKPAQNDSYIPKSNQINISQILMDFKNTMLAINAPDDIQDEVNTYLSLVEKEAHKQEPSKDIIFSNLKNASKISDNFITGALGKKSNVVEGWITTIFRQNINLKANPDEINPDFLLKFPQKTETPTVEQKEEVQPFTIEPSEITNEKPSEVVNEEIKISDNIVPDTPEEIEINSSIDVLETDEEDTVDDEPKSPFSANNDYDEKAKILYAQAKRLVKSDNDSTSALNMLNDALGYLNEDSNSNIKAAIHFERAKIFDSYDYVDYALRDYFEATKASDLNLKANAFYQSGSIYDEFREFAPALDNYLSSVAYSGEADNLSAQSRVLSKISSLYARQYDIQNAHDYADLAIDSAVDSKNSDAIAQTYSSIAQNYQYLGDNKKALENYKNALAEFSRSDESYEKMAFNYSEASKVMRELGNIAKAEKLQAKARQYYQKAQLQQDELAKAS